MPSPWSAERPLTGRHMAGIFVAFFAVVVGVNLTMATLARRSWTGLVVPNSYVASQQFNTKTLERETVLARGDRVQLQYADEQLRLSLTDNTGRPLHITSAKFDLFQNVAHSESSLELSCTNGMCATSVALAPGFWRGDMQLDIQDLGSSRQAVEIMVEDK